jgi:tetratricopeptide (TPR) repeat protein
MTGDYERAASDLAEALSLYRDVGDVGGVAELLNEMGVLYRSRGDLPRAEDYHREALRMAREIASPMDEGVALAGLGRCSLSEGHITEGGTWLRQAQIVFERLGTAEAQAVTRELKALT